MAHLKLLLTLVAAVFSTLSTSEAIGVGAMRMRQLVWRVQEPHSTVDCDDKTSCPDGTTCCILPGGDFGCCPFPNAVCCVDKQHCCPQGYQCDLVDQTCVRDMMVVPLARKLPGINMEARDVGSITCADNSTCDLSQTCCILEDGSFGCCPFPDAVCCGDKQHCCPTGFICNSVTMQCERGRGFFQHLGKIESRRVESKAVPCPDGNFCPDKTTCCQQPSGYFGCCPFPLGVCCADRVTCCPHGFKCNLATKQCYL